MLSGDMLVSIDVDFPTMKMRMETVSRFGGDESTTCEVRRKPDGTWEYRLTPTTQSRNLKFLRELLVKAERFESLTEEQRSEEPDPYEETHGLIADDSVAEVVKAIEQTEANEWLPFVGDNLREVMPQIEFQYAKLMKSM
jgi:hypothetical protein